LAGPKAVLADLSCYTHRVAIANSRLLALDERGVTFRWKDYRARAGARGHEWIKTMTLPANEFIRRFLLPVLPDGFHRIRHSGLFASATRVANIAGSGHCSLRGRHRAKPIPSPTMPRPLQARAAAAASSSSNASGEVGLRR